MKTNIIHQIEMRRVRYNYNEGFALIQQLKDFEDVMKSCFLKKDFCDQHYYSIPVIICSAFETFFRAAIKKFIDTRYVSLEKLLRIDVIKNYHINLNICSKLLEKEISIGEVASELIKLNGIENISNVLSILLDLNLIPTLTSFDYPTRSNDLINTEKYWLSNYQQILKDINSVYEIRNIHCHEFGFWIEIKKDAFLRYLKHAIIFLERTNNFFDFLIDPPKTKIRKVKEDTVARKRFVQKERELDQLIKKILEAFDELGYDTEPSEEDFKNEMILWKQYRKKLAKSNCEKYLGVTNFKFMYWLNMERITDEKIESLSKQNENLFFEVEIHSKVQRFD